MFLALAPVFAPALAPAAGCTAIVADRDALEDERAKGPEGGQDLVDEETNYCVAKFHFVHESASLQSAKVALILTGRVWHHHHQQGAWSFGYVVGKSPVASGFVPRSILGEDIGDETDPALCEKDEE